MIAGTTPEKGRKFPKLEHTFDGWCFAIINNRLSEIFFGRKKGKCKKVIWAHCYVKRSEYKTKREQKMIVKDTKRCRFTYRNKKYIRKEI